MGRPSKLSPAQWAEVERRIASGEVLRDLAIEYGVSPAAISRKGFTQQSKRVQGVAQQVAIAQSALAELPIREQYAALSMADEIRGLQTDVLAATRLGAKSGLRLHALANSELQKVDDAAVLTEEASVNSLKTVAVLTKMGNEALNPALNLLSANKERVQRLEDAPPADAPQTSGVLMVPGLMADPNAWSQATQAAAKGTT